MHIIKRTFEPNLAGMMF